MLTNIQRSQVETKDLYAADQPGQAAARQAGTFVLTQALVD
jgi:hypothetical protein